MTDDDKKYNGWTNYQTWNVNLWMDQEEYIVNTLQKEWAAEARKKSAESLKFSEVSAAYYLSEIVKEYVLDSENGLVPDLGATMAADLLGSALDNVDWREIADGILDTWPAEEEEDDESEDDDNDSEDLTCDQCNAAMIQGVYCHEVGCPNKHKVKIAGKWTTPDPLGLEDDSDESALYDVDDGSEDLTHD